MADPNVGVLLSTTLKNYNKTLVDNIHKSSAFFYTLKKSGGMITKDGGERLVMPVMYGKNSTAKSYSGYEQLDTTPQTGVDSAEYNWKQLSVSITISGEEERKNNGRSKIIDLLDAKVKQAEMSLVEELNTQLFSNGTGNSSKDITGLEAMVLASGTYGGIDSATYTWWQSNLDTNSEALSVADMRTIYNSCSIGGRDNPNLIITTQTLYEKYEGFATVTSTTNVAGSYVTKSEGEKGLFDAGFTTLGFKGVPVVWDELCPAGTMYILNTKHMKLVAHQDANFTTTDFVKPENQDARIAQVLFMGNLTCDRRKSQGKLSNKT